MRYLSLILSLTACLPALAWENHALLTTLAIMDMQELRDAKPVKVETLEQFLAAEPLLIARLLAEEETWDILHVLNYPPRPTKLAFSTSDPSVMRQRFIEAMRINPNSKFALFLQEMPGRKIPGAKYMPPADVTLLPGSLPATSRSFAQLTPGQFVSPAEVFATATDEPDYGIDIKLWSNSGTDFGKRYGFGDQPFGNPKLEYGSQAAFHMGFYHEAGIVDWTASQITHTLPEYRIHQFFSLARLAFQSGHDYWGWRFAGMGAHYIQDLTQPYHAKVLPGGSTFRLLYTGALDEVGIHGPKNKVVEQASDEHIALEKQAYCAVLQAYQPGGKTDSMTNALRQSTDDKEFYKSSYVRNVLTAESYEIADDVAKMLRPMLGSAKPGCPTPNSINAETLFAKLMKNFGQHTRGFIRAALPPRNLQK